MIMLGKGTLADNNNRSNKDQTDRELSPHLQKSGCSNWAEAHGLLSALSWGWRTFLSRRKRKEKLSSLPAPLRMQRKNSTEFHKAPVRLCWKSVRGNKHFLDFKK